MLTPIRPSVFGLPSVFGFRFSNLLPPPPPGFAFDFVPAPPYIASFNANNLNMLTEDDIKNALKAVKYPGYSRDIVSFGLVKQIAAKDGAVSVAMQLTTGQSRTWRTRSSRKANAR